MGPFAHAVTWVNPACPTMTIKLRSLYIACLVIATSASPALPSPITFETFQNGSAAIDNAALDRTTPYLTNGIGVRFGFDTDNNSSVETNAHIEQTGGSLFGPHAFTRGTSAPPPVGSIDTAAPGFESQLGDFFLRRPGGAAANEFTDFGTFVIEFDPMGNLVTGATGEIWDIDASLNDVNDQEQYRIQAFDGMGNLLGTIDSPLGLHPGIVGSLDGRPFVFSFTDQLAGIERIEITFTGTRAQGIGFAFNNFDTTVQPLSTPVPEPAPLIIWTLLGLIGFGYGWRRRVAEGQPAQATG